MQKILNIILIGLIFLASCKDQNYLHDKYLAQGEIIYDGGVNSLKAFSGIGRVKLQWINTFDSKVTKCNISWNNGEESLLFNISDVLVDTNTNMCEKYINNLDEGYYTFVLVNEDAFGNKSLPVNIQTKVLGDQVISGSSNLLFQSAYSIGGNTYVMSITPKPFVYGVKLSYDNMSGGTTTIYQPITTTMNTFTIKEAKAGGNYSYKSQYFLESSIDSFYTASANSGTLPAMATNVAVSNIASLGINNVTVTFTPKQYSTGVNFTYAKSGGGTITQFIPVTSSASTVVINNVQYEGGYSYVTQYAFKNESNYLAVTVTGILPKEYYAIVKTAWLNPRLYYDIPANSCASRAVTSLWDGNKTRTADFKTGCNSSSFLPCLVTIDLSKNTLIKEMILTSSNDGTTTKPTRVQLWGITNFALNPEVDTPFDNPNWQTVAESKGTYVLIVDATITGTWNNLSDYSIQIPANTTMYRYVRLRIFSSTNTTSLNEITFMGYAP